MSGQGLTVELDNIIAVVDCARMFDEFAGGKDLLADEIDDEDIEALLVQQIEFCTTLVLNKCDLVSPEQIAELKAIVRGLQKEARIVESTQASVDLDELLNTGRFDFNEAYNSAAWIDAMEHPEEHEDPEVLEYDIATFVYQRRKPFSMASFERCVQGWPDAVIRTKGLVWLADDPNMAYVLEQAGKQVSLRDAGLWFATMPANELAMMMDREPTLRRDWDDTYGDRMQKLVFIGQHLDKDALAKELDACLTR